LFHAKEDGALLHVDIVAGGPFDLGSGGLGRYHSRLVSAHEAFERAVSAPPFAESFIETADGIVIVGDREEIVGSPAVVKP